MARVNYTQKHVEHTVRRKLFEARDFRRMRRLLGVSQADFWKPVGITQSAGSRYESGRSAAAPVLQLVRLYWVEGIEFDKLSRDDVAGLRQLEWEGE